MRCIEWLNDINSGVLDYTIQFLLCFFSTESILITHLTNRRPLWQYKWPNELRDVMLRLLIRLNNYIYTQLKNHLTTLNTFEASNSLYSWTI
jgi:hypothetical protein